MITERIDLYEYFKKDRGTNNGGYLNVCMESPNAEMGINSKHPAMLVIPGGGYAFVSCREAEVVAVKYVAAGFATFTLDYSIVPENKNYAPLKEGAMAMLFIRENSEKYKINKNEVAAVGFSAGGHLAASLATIFNDELFVNEFGSEKTNLIRPDAVVLSYSVISAGKWAHTGSLFNLCNGKTSEYERFSLEKRVSDNNSPAFIWCTADDEAVPAMNSLMYAAALAEKKIPYELHVFSVGQHGLSVVDESVLNKTFRPHTPSAETWLQLCLTWLKERGFGIKE